MVTNMIDYLRYALYAMAIALGLLLYQAWDKDHPQAAITSPTVTETANNYVPSSVPTQTTASGVTAPAATQAAPVTNSSGHIIHVVTDVLDVDIDTLGGNITQVNLAKYPENLDSNAPYLLLNDNPNSRYIAQSGLLSSVGPDKSAGQAVYQADQTSYTMSPDQKTVTANLVWQNTAGIKVTKSFTFTRGSYAVDLSYQVNNQSSVAWDGNMYLQLLRTNTPPVTGSKGLFNLPTFFGAAVYDTAQKHFQKIQFKNMVKENLNQPITGGWAAMVQHYFVSAWIPEQTVQSNYFTRVTQDGLYTVGSIGPKVVVNPGNTANFSAKFYAGPSSKEQMENVATGLPLTIDYGVFWIIAVTLFWMMQQIHSVVGNWGWSIVLVTLAVKLVFYHLSAKSYRSMSIMKKLQPRINSLKERFGDDKQKFTQATLELYRKEKVNPMSGCLPVLVQIPVFIGLYWVLIESVQLRQAPFILWIHDLSQKDPYYILPLLMGLSMFLQQRLNPPPPDPMQAKLMMFMPVIFTVLFLNFPAGLMLYWCVNNSLSFLQQWFIMHGLDKAEKAKVKKS